MSATAITLILIAAVAHASWNLFSKQAAQTGAISFIWLAATAATLLYIPVIAIAWAGGWLHLTALGWVFMAGTGVLESAYFVFLQSGYRLGDLSLVYPVGRGTGALLAAVAGIAFLGERPGPVAIGGIIAVVAGIALIGAPIRAQGRKPPGRGRLGAGRAPRRPRWGRLSGSPSRPGCSSPATRCGTGTRSPPWARRRCCRDTRRSRSWPWCSPCRPCRAKGRTALVWHRYRAQVAGAAVLMPLAYILVLAALAFTAVSVVAPAREVSVLFGVLMGGRLLGEGSVARRLTAAVAIAAGIIAIAVG